MKKYLLFGFLLIALFGLGLTSFVRSFDLKSINLIHSGHAPDPDVVILAIDDKSISAIGRWPWPRSVEANIIEKLAEYSPRAVGFDINFTETEDPTDDAALATSINSASFPIVLPVEAIQMSDGSSAYLYPLPSLITGTNVSLGHVNVTLAADGEGRLLPTPIETPQGEVPPFSVAIARDANANVQKLLSDDTTYAINFAGPAGTFPTFSISDFLNGAIPASALTNKIILIGATANDLHDVVLVPVGSGIMAGVEWHANIIDNVLLNRLYSVPNSIAVDLAGIMLAAILLILFSRMRVRIALIITIIVLIAIPVTSYIELHAENVAISYFWSEIIIIVAFGGYGFAKWYAAEIEKQRIRRTVQNYFSPAVLNAILKNPKLLTLGGERKEVTILFSDIRSFTTITESLAPELLTKLLHEYFTEMAEEIFASDGVLDKFIGDAIMAFWGAPIDQPDHADRAVRAAQGMIHRLVRLQKKWVAEGFPFVDIGVGIHTGDAIVGNMGSEKRFDYTVIGDAVNAASRLEGLNKEYKTHIIISEATKEKLKHSVETRGLGDVMVKGKTKAITIYEVK